MAKSKSKAFSPLDLVEVEDRATPEAREGPPRKWFVVDPDVMYPAVIAAIVAGVMPSDRSQVIDGKLEEDHDAGHYRRALTRVRVHYKNHIDDALLPLVEQAEGPPLSPVCGLDPHRRAIRADILEVARLWFTNELQRAVGGPIGLHILKSERWTL